MEISSTTLSVSSLSPAGFRLSSSSSASFNTISLFNKSKKCDSLAMAGGRPRIHRAKKGMTCNALFGLGVPELVVIAGVAALVFGPKKLPEVGKSIGKTVKSFQQVGCFRSNLLRGLVCYLGWFEYGAFLSFIVS